MSLVGSKSEPFSSLQTYAAAAARGGATLWLGGAWAPPRPTARAPRPGREGGGGPKYNFYPYSLKNL
jgi:hypothetical protein